MTDKEQIIIDGVDVSRCIDFNKKDKVSCYHILYDKCNENPNCYYKQLARKTQELETICKAFDIEYGYDEGTGVIVGRCNKLIEKEKELDKFKQSLDEKNKFLQDLGISAGGEFKRIKFYIENLKNKYNEKTEECEELISEKDFYLQKIAVLEQECEELKEQLQANQPTGICETCMAEAILQNDKYRKALEEIEEYIYTDCEYNDGCDRNICIRCDYSNVHDKRILDIINKAKDINVPHKKDGE